VHRNHGFEPVATAVPPYAAWNRLEYRFTIGAFDDSLSFEQPGDADAELVWFDTRRLSNLSAAELGDWMTARLRALRSGTPRPILLLAWPLPAAAAAAVEAARIPGLLVADLEAMRAQLPDASEDRRLASLSGTTLGNAACLCIARELACRWLPASLRPPLKAIAVDLDDTLYSGVLGEDGASGVELTSGHHALQERLVQFQRQGVLLALISRNELDDVRQLFRSRTDFPLRLEDFSAVEVSWGDKAEALERIASRLRIGTDAMVFVDDNPGELASVANRLQSPTVHARPDGHDTVSALSHVAGLWRWKQHAEDSFRAGDLRAAKQRDELARSSASPGEYLRSLQIRLGYLVNPVDHLARVHELGQKTNQFTLALRRFAEAELAARMRSESAGVVAIRLSDRLSDSGIVAFLVGAWEADTLRIEELCVSCRALGRHLEDVMLARGIVLLAHGKAIRKVTFDAIPGPRNRPALEWLQRFAGSPPIQGRAQPSVTLEAVAARSRSGDVAVEVAA
jgi:FkbH-like protein